MTCASRILARTIVLFPFLVAAFGSSAQAQSRFEWPERAKNLKVLPDTTSADQLRAAMMAFTRSLGVRCAHCHVGEEGKPLETFDFASDANPKKDIARNMMRMVGDIHADLAKMNLAGTKRVNVSCFTCHHGRPLPRTLAEELTSTYETAGIDSTIVAYNELRERFYGRASYDFGVGSLNEVGSSLLSQGHNDDALRVLQLNVEQNPDAVSAHVSLGDAYASAGKKDQAAAAYRKALELEPENSRVKQKLEELEGAK